MKKKKIQDRCRLIVCGDPEFDNARLLERKIDKYTALVNELVIVSPHDTVLTREQILEDIPVGADRHGEKFAGKRHLLLMVYYAEDRGEKINIKAQKKRNEDMVKNADLLIAFVDQLKGPDERTKLILECARKHKLERKVVKY